MQSEVDSVVETALPALAGVVRCVREESETTRNGSRWGSFGAADACDTLAPTEYFVSIINESEARISTW